MIHFQGEFDDRPEPGTYPIEPVRWDAFPDRPDQGFYAYYSWLEYRDDHTIRGERYAALEGHVEILSSSPEVVEGRFELAAVRYCKTAASGTEGPCGETAPDPDGPGMAITGTFTTVPLNQTDWVDLGPVP